MRSRRAVAPWAIALAALATIAPAAHAASYSYFYRTVTSNFNSNAAGTTLTVKVYLEEVDNSNNPNATSSLINTEDGLSGGAFTITRTGGTASSLTGVAGNPGAAPAGFSGSVTTAGSGNARSVSESATLFAPGARVFAVSPGGFNAVYLGTASILVGAGAATTFTVGPYSGDASTTNATGYNLDNNLDGGDSSALYSNAASSPFVVRAAVVPEPATLAALGAAAALGMRRRRRA